MFFISFCCCTFICCCIFICRFSSFTFHLLFDIIPHPSVDYRPVFTPILYFQLSSSQSDSRYFHFQPFRYLLTASATVLSGRFLPTGVFYLTLLHRHFWLNLHLWRLSLGADSSSVKFAGLYLWRLSLGAGRALFMKAFPRSWQFFLEVCRALYWSLKHRTGPSVCLNHSNSQSSYSEQFIFKFYHILAWITCGKKFSL